MESRLEHFRLQLGHCASLGAPVDSHLLLSELHRRPNCYCLFFPTRVQKQRPQMTDWFDFAKYNVIAFQLTATDLSLQPILRRRRVPSAILAAVLARRGQNESVHFKYTVQKYASDDFGTHSESNLDALP